MNQFAVVGDQPGGTRHLEMSRELARLGQPVTVVASDLNLTSRSYSRRRDAADRRHIGEDLDGARFLWLPAGMYVVNDWRRMVSMLIFSWHVLKMLLRAPMPAGSVVIGSSPHLLAAGAARLAAAVRRVPFVLEVRDLWPESLAVGGESRGPVHRSLRILADVLYRTSDEIIILAAGNAPAIEARGVPASRLHFIPNGVDPTAFEGVTPRRPEGVPASAKLAVYAGAHGPANGLDVVLAAAAVLEEQGVDDVHLVLVGDGPEKAALQAQARRLALSNVTFHDPVPKSVVPALLAACDIGLMPLADVELFRHGVSPNKLFDYLCAGLVVVTNVPGEVAAMVEDAAAGIVVDPADPVGLAAAVRDACGDDRAFEHGGTWVAATHDRRVLAGELLRVVTDAAAGRPPTP